MSSSSSSSSSSCPPPEPRDEPTECWDGSQELEIPYRLDFSVDSKDDENDSSDGGYQSPQKLKGEPIRPGDVIKYTCPIFISGSRQGERYAMVLGTDPYQPDFPLVLDNAECLPWDTPIQRIGEYYKGELHKHPGKTKSIQDFTFGKKGNNDAVAGLKLQAKEFKATMDQLRSDAIKALRGELFSKKIPKRNSLSSSSSSSSSSDDCLVVPSTKKSKLPKPIDEMASFSSSSSSCPLPSVSSSLKMPQSWKDTNTPTNANKNTITTTTNNNSDDEDDDDDDDNLLLTQDIAFYVPPKQAKTRFSLSKHNSCQPPPPPPSVSSRPTLASPTNMASTSAASRTKPRHLFDDSSSCSSSSSSPTSSMLASRASKKKTNHIGSSKTRTTMPKENKGIQSIINDTSTSDEDEDDDDQALLRPGTTRRFPNNDALSKSLLYSNTTAQPTIAAGSFRPPSRKGDTKPTRRKPHREMFLSSSDDDPNIISSTRTTTKTIKPGIAMGRNNDKRPFKALPLDKSWNESLAHGRTQTRNQLCQSNSYREHNKENKRGSFDNKKRSVYDLSSSSSSSEEEEEETVVPQMPSSKQSFTKTLSRKRTTNNRRVATAKATVYGMSSSSSSSSSSDDDYDSKRKPKMGTPWSSDCEVDSPEPVPKLASIFDFESQEGPPSSIRRRKILTPNTLGHKKKKRKKRSNRY